MSKNKSIKLMSSTLNLSLLSAVIVLLFHGPTFIRGLAGSLRSWLAFLKDVPTVSIPLRVPA